MRTRSQRIVNVPFRWKEMIKEMRRVRCNVIGEFVIGLRTDGTQRCSCRRTKAQSCQPSGSFSQAVDNSGLSFGDGCSAGYHLCSEADDKLCNNITSNSSHLLYHLLPPKRDIHYSLRPRAHDFSLSTRTTLLNDHNYITRMLFKNIGCL